jgi:rare lipoprotein A
MTEFRGYHTYLKLNSRMELDDMRFQTAIILIVLAAPAYAGQTVRATWYGHELAGNRTASGERFNPNGLTAAHRSLPFGTCLRVGNPKTGRSVSVRVNDRGPFTKGISLDLSYGAAQAIGMRSTQNVTVNKC